MAGWKFRTGIFAIFYLSSAGASGENMPDPARPTPHTLGPPLTVPKAQPLPKPKKLFDPQPTGSLNTATPQLPTKRKYVAPDAELPQAPRPTADIQQTSATVTFDRTLTVDVPVQSDTNFQRVFFSVDALLTHLEEFMRDDVYQDLSNRLRGRAWIGTRELRELGFELELLVANYRVNFETPSQYRRVKKKRVNNRFAREQLIDLWPAVNSSSLSGYWNRVAVDKNIARETLSTEFIWTHRNMVFENNHRYDALTQNNIRQSSVVSWDFKDDSSRLNIGDIQYRTIGLMGNLPLLGVSFGTHLNINPNLIYNPITHQVIFLEGASDIKIYVNNALYRQMSLPAGYYDLVDFPLVNGINNVIIEAKDKNGRTRFFNYNGLSDTRILTQGIRDFGLAAGVPRQSRIDGSVQYLTQTPMFSAFYRHGYTPYIATGITGEGDEQYVASSVYGAFLTRFGTFELNSALGSETRAAKIRDFAISGEYVLNLATTAVSLSTRYTSEFYRRLGQNLAFPQAKYSTAATVSFPTVLGIRTILRSRHIEQWDNLRENSITLRFDTRFSKSISTGIEFYTRAYAGSSRTDRGVMADLTWTPWRYVSSRGAYDTTDHQKTASLSINTGTKFGATASSNATESDKSRSLAGNLSLNTRRFEFSFSGTESQDRQSLQRNRFEQYSVSSGLAYADGALAWGQSLKKTSFVIVKNIDNADDVSIKVGRGVSDDTFFDLSGNSSILFSGLGAYNTSPIFAKVEDSDTGYRLDKDKTQVFSTFRSGALLRLKGDMSVYGSGVLENQQGSPIPVTMARAVRESDGHTVEFFTDQTGQFQIDGLRTGHYRIVIENSSGSGEFDVSPTPNSSVELGTVIFHEP